MKKYLERTYLTCMPEYVSYNNKLPKSFLFKSFFLFFPSIIISLSSFSQELYGSQRRYQLGISIASTLIPKPTIKREFGRAELLTRKTFGFETGITLKYIVSDYINLNTGVYFGKLPYSWGLNVSPNEFPDNLEFPIVDQGAAYFINYWYFPLNVELMLSNSDKIRYDLLAGVNRRHYLDGHTSIGYQFQDTAGITHNIMLVSLDVNYPYKIRLNYQLGLNATIKLKHLNDLKISILHNFSFANIVDGMYGFFLDTNEFTFGSYTMTGTYSALSFGYILTGEKKFSGEKNKSKPPEVKLIN